MDITQERAHDEQAIRATIQQGVDAWNAGDGQGYGMIFEDDADYVTFGGTHTSGRERIAAEHQQLFDTFLRGSRLRLEVTSLRFLSEDVALLHAVGGILDEPGQVEVTPLRRSIQAVVLRRHGPIWRIASSQVTRILPPLPGVNVPPR